MLYSSSPLNGQAAELWDKDPAEFKRLVLARHKTPEELDAARHYVHVQPPMTPSGRFHIVIDLETSKHSGTLPSDFPHEIYRVLPKDGIT